MIIQIVATDINNGIGKGGRIPWTFFEDLRFFKKTTLGHWCIMGKKTYDSIPSRVRSKNQVLTGRKSFVLSNNNDFNPPDAIRLPKLMDIFEYYRPNIEGRLYNLFVCGGVGLYRDTIEIANCLMITRISKKYDCDVFYPFDSESINQHGFIKDGESLPLVDRFGRKSEIISRETYIRHPIY